MSDEKQKPTKQWSESFADVLADRDRLRVQFDALREELDTERRVTDRACAAADEAALERDQHYDELAALRSALTEAGVTPDAEGVRALEQRGDRLLAERNAAQKRACDADLELAGMRIEMRSRICETVRDALVDEARIRADERARTERDIAAAGKAGGVHLSHVEVLP